jgi:hypothetical protein
MTEPSSGTVQGEFLSISREELARARRRLGEPVWSQAAENLRAEANKLLQAVHPLPAFDCSWFDACPDRDFLETYVPFHDYARPAWELAQAAATLLRAWAIFGDERYLERSRQWLMHVAEHFRFHVQHHDAGLGYSHIAEPFAEALGVLSQRLSAVEGEQLRRQAEACGQAIVVNRRHWLTNLARMPYNNHLAAHDRGLLSLGLALERRDWVDEALDGERGFGELLVGATRDDGLCYESSTLYHFATLESLVHMAELVRHQPRLGRDLYRETFANGRTLKQMFDAPLGLLLPNGELPALGDCYAERQPLWVRTAGLYEMAYAVYGDPRYAWLLQQGGSRTTPEALIFGADRLEPAEPPAARSRAWVEHGYALLTSCSGRAYWAGQASDRPAGMVVVLTGDYSGIHCHNDKLSLQVAAGGRLWVEDVESEAVEAHGFSAPIQKSFNRTMLAHNLVVVDEQDQKPLEQPLKIVEFTELPTCRTATMADLDGAIADGVRMRRSVIVTADYGLDLFQVSSFEERRYDWLLHPRSDGPADCGGRVFAATVLLERAPYSTLRDAGASPVAESGARIEWSQERQRFRLDLSAVSAEGWPLGGELVRAAWPVKSDWSTGGREMFMFRVRSASAAFVALYQLAGTSSAWRVALVERRRRGACDEVRLVVSNGAKERQYVLRGL